MALSAREMLLMVRVEDRASNALRRIAHDVGGLSGMKQLQARSRQLAVNEQVLRTQRQQAKYNEENYRTGARALSLSKQRLLQEAAMTRAIEEQSLATKALRTNQAALSAANARARTLGTAVNTGISTTPPAVRAANMKALKEAQVEAERLTAAEAGLRRQIMLANDAVAKQAVNMEILAASEAKAARMADYWAGRQKIATERLAINAEKQVALNRAINDAKWDRLAAGGRVMQHTSRLFGYAGLIVGGSLAYMASAAAKFNTESTLAATQATNKWHQTAAGVLQVSRVISKGLLDMAGSGQTTAKMQDNQAAIYDIFSSMTLKGSQASQIKQGIALLREFNQASIAGQVDIKEVTTAGITILNNFADQGKQVQELPKLLNRMFAAVRFGRMTVSEFVGSLSQVAPAFGAAFGSTPKTFDQLAGAMATVTRYIPKMGTVSAGLARLSEMFGRRDFVDGMKKSGVAIVDATGHLKPFNTIIDDIAKRFPKLRGGGLALQNFFKDITALGSGKAGTMGTIQARRVLQELILHQREYHKLQQQVIGDNNEFDKSFKAMSNTSGVKWQLFVQQLHAFAIELGTAVIPIITRLGKPIMEAVHWFNSLSDSAKNQIGTWASWGAVIAIGAGATTMLVGTFIRMIAFMGKGIGLFGTMSVVIIAAAAAISALSGNWNGLNGIIDTFVSYGTGSIAGWVTMLGLAAVAALKLRGALVSVAAVEGASGAGGVLGLFGRTRGAVAGVRDLYQVKRLEGAGRLMSGLAASAAMIPGSLLLAGGAMVAVGVGALAWKHHMDDVRKAAEAAAAAMANVKRLGSVPAAQAAKLGGLAGATTGAEQAAINLRSADKAIAEARKKGTSGDALKQLFIDRYNAAVSAQQANDKADKLFNGLSGSLAGQANLLNNLGKQSALLKRLQTQRGKQVAQGTDTLIYASGATGVSTMQDFERLDKRIAAVTARMQVLNTSAMKGANSLANNFSVAVTGLGKLEKIKISPTAISDMFKFALQKGRMLTLPEIRAFVRAEVDPKYLAKVRSDIRAAVTGAERGRMVAAGKASIVAIKPKPVAGWQAGLFKSPIPMLSKIIAPKNVAAVHKSVAKVFQRNIVQRITISPGPAGARARGVVIGAALAKGAQSGIDANTAAVVQAAVSMVDQAAAAARHHAGIKSPSRLFAETVGKPIGQGIALGILEARGDIAKAAALTVDLFQGSILSNFSPGKKSTKLQIDRALHSLTTAQAALKKHATESNKQRVEIATENLAAVRDKGGKKITAGMLTKDLQSQLKDMRTFNNGMATLQKRHVPQAMLEELRALGVSGASNIAKLAGMTKPQLAKYIALWRSANKEVTKSTKFTAADVKSALKSMAKDAAQSLLDTYNGFKDTNTQNFGDLFGGPTGLSDKIGQTFQDALDQYNSSMKDYQTQITDLNKQLADVNVQAFNDMSSSFGLLFSGDWLSGTDVQTRVDWGQKLGFDDLFKDLQSQVDKFNHWRNDLTSLAGKVPKALADQLAALGPDAVSQLDILNGATTDQLSQYVTLWQQAQGNIGDAAGKALTTNDTYITQINDIMKQIGDVNTLINTLVAPTALTSGDLTKDIQTQIDKWGEYQGTLAELINRGLPATLVQQLQNMGPTAEPYLKALTTMTDSQLLGKGGFADKWQTANQMIVSATNSMMNTQLGIWYSYGANSAAQLIAGVGSQQAPLLAYFTNLFQNLLTGKMPAFTPPSSDPTASLGGDAVARYIQNQQANSGSGGNTFMTVHATQDESLQTTLERATFRLDNRNPQ